MIAYFANRALHILGIASTDLRNEEVALITDDSIVESLEAGSSSLDMTVNFNDHNRLQIQDMMEAGNYVLLNVDREKRYYTIIDTEIDTSNRTVSIYAEDAGLDLLNEIVGPSIANQEYPISHYINQCIYDTGFSIRYNEFDTDTKKVLSWDSQQTAAERLLEIASTFKAEIQYSFRINGMDIKRKYIDVYKKKGKEQSHQFRLGVDVDNMRVTRSVANLCTCLEVEGGQDVHGNTLTFNYPTQMEYDNGDIYISGSRLYSRKALERWSRYVYDEEPRQIANVGHIVGYFQYDTTNRTELRTKAIEYLKKVYDVEVNYDISINRLDENIELGDTISIVDDKDEIYLTARVLEIQSSVTKRTRTCTLGNFKKKTSGINPKLQRLADNFERIASARSFYTWIVYADDDQGTGISLSSFNKPYIGIASNKTVADADLSDPSIYTWSLYVGPEGEQGPQGPQGEKGEQGETGNGITSTVITYGVSDSGTDSSQVTWQSQPDVIPDVPQGKYLWTRTTTTYSNGNVTNTYSVAYKATNGINGQNAKNITSVTTLYVLKNPGETPTQNDPNWSSTPPSYEMGKKYWRMDYIVFEGGSTAKSTPVLDNAMNDAMEAAMAAIVSDVKQYCVASSDEPNECYIYTYAEFTGSTFESDTLYFEKVNSLLSSEDVEGDPLPYDSTATYAVDDFIFRDDKIYKCVEAITVPEEFNESKWTAVVYYIYIPTADNSKVNGKTYYYVSNKTEPTWYNDSIYNVITNDSKNFFENNYIWSRNKITYGSGRIEYLNLTVEPISNLFTRNITFDAGINELDDRINLTAESISTVSDKFDPIEDRIATIENNAILSVEPGAITGTISEYVDSKVGEGIENSGINEIQEQLLSVTAQLTTDGFTVSKSDQGTSSLIDGEGLKVIKKVDGQDVIVAQFTNDDSEVDYLEVRRFLTFGAHRAETVQMLEWDGATSTMGTGFFYNGIDNQNGSS